ncbi:myb-like protein A isoform X2 [Musca domestica]|nr:myb-like protein A isoform X2 [Musca domestica]XP_011291248.1 myb-like protein A isoform X2 [Musca domestica]
MQEISRDDFSLLNVGDSLNSSNSHTEKDMCPTLISRIQSSSPISPVLPKRLTPVDIYNAAPATAFASVKLEDTNTLDLFPSHPSTWQQHPMNSHEFNHHRLSVHHHHHHHHHSQRFDHSNNSKLLLQGSEDPLISHGANNVISHDDEHPADFAKCLLTSEELPQTSSSSVAAAQESPIFTTIIRKPVNGPPPPPLHASTDVPAKPIKSGCSNLTKQQLKVKANLMSARNQQQQQQLQQQQQQQQQRENNVSSTTMSNQCPSQKIRNAGATKTRKKTNTSIKLRFHHQALPPEYLSHYEATQGQTRPTKPAKSTTNPQRPAQKSSNRNSHENVRSWLQKIAEIQRTANASKNADNKVCNTQQSSLDSNNNPQNQSRNHGPTTAATTAIPGNSEASSSNTTAKSVKSVNHRKTHFYSDLPYMGEITLDNSKPRRGRKPKKADICHLIYKNYGTIMPKNQTATHDSQVDLKHRLEDKHTKTDDGEEQPLNLCLRDQQTDAYSISSADDASETNSSCPTPPITTPSDIDRDSMLANNLKRSLTNLNELDNDHIKLEAKDMTPTTSHHPSSNANTEGSPLDPLTLYYQKLLESGVLLQNANGPIKTIQKDNQLALKIPIPSGLFLTPKVEKTLGTASSPAPSVANSLNLDYPEQLSTPSSIKSENSTATNASSSTVIGNNTQQNQTPQKRKRSAIFIPPMNTENTSNPATEVSICKFKFTGGSKPTLQEKKMLSVDAGGNYRYFSGTGDKTTRGYEYFPREMMQSGGLTHGTGQKLLIDIPPPSAGLSNELLHIPESPTANMLLQPVTSSSVITHTAISAKATPPPPPPTGTVTEEMPPSEPCVQNYFEENFDYNQTPSTSPSSTNRFMLSRKKQALHQLRRSTQREKLEKTFKEQGFLIQTQQLESAEGATYCKFRQLKKFTRYLFRNWKDYLPDDIHRNGHGPVMASPATSAIACAAAATDEKEGSLANLSLHHHRGDFPTVESVVARDRGEEHIIE